MHACKWKFHILRKFQVLLLHAYLRAVSDPAGSVHCDLIMIITGDSEISAIIAIYSTICGYNCAILYVATATAVKEL